MGLTGWMGEHANDALVRYALEHGPFLVIDAANCADPYRHIAAVPAERFDDVHVVGFDLIYSLPDALRDAPQQLERLGTKSVAVTAFHRLFNYHDTEENADVHSHAWDLLRGLARRYDVHVAVLPGRGQEALAKIYCDALRGDAMGHTVSSQRQVVDTLLGELEAFGKALRAEDRPYYRASLRASLQYLSAIQNAASLHAWAFILLAALTEQQKRLEHLEEELARRR